ncbi:hypothetical protein J4476_05520 [Candidatus Woesearchaeota archaeon]|nr:hypothetical protein [Candidatus Woesearchaeota archaeon]
MNYWIDSFLSIKLLISFMNRNQWLVLSIGLFLAGSILVNFSMFCGGFTDELLTSCMIQRYAFGIPSIIMGILGVLFFIIALLEPKKKNLD